MDIKVKVCGMKYASNMEGIADVGVDFIGCIFHNTSPRFVGLDLQTASWAHPDVKKVGVFVNASPEEIENTIEKYNLDMVQLHGQESPDLCGAIKDKGTPVMKAISIRTKSSFDKIELYEGKVDYFIFDTYTPLHGGSGKVFDWKWLNNYTLQTPFFISGGIQPTHVEEIKKIKHPQFVGVDVNSGFELSHGLKSVQEVKKFTNRLKNN